MSGTFGGYIQVSSCGTLTWVSGEAAAMIGYEGMGPQKADAPDQGALTEQALYDALVQINNGLVAETRGRELQDAMAAVHRQHTRDGRPNRYLPEA